MNVNLAPGPFQTRKMCGRTFSAYGLCDLCFPENLSTALPECLHSMTVQYG